MPTALLVSGSHDGAGSQTEQATGVRPQDARLRLHGEVELFDVLQHPLQAADLMRIVASRDEVVRPDEIDGESERPDAAVTFIGALAAT
jgi:hypothetical protein